MLVIQGGDAGGGYKATWKEKLLVWFVAVCMASAVAIAIWGKWVSEGSDYQRLERLEERVTQLEAER